MGFFSNILSATVKVALTPLAIVNDAMAVVTGEEPKSTKGILKSAEDDFSDAIDDVLPKI